MQTTIRSATGFSGVGLHSNRPTRVMLRPAPAGHGIRFRRTDLADADADAEVAARWDSVVPSGLCTVIANAGGVSVSTIRASDGGAGPAPGCTTCWQPDEAG